MTPEQIAADCIARAVQSARDAVRPRTPAEVGRDAVERMSAAQLVLMTAERAVQLLDSERLAAAITREAGNDHAVAALTAAREKALARERGIG